MKLNFKRISKVSAVLFVLVFIVLMILFYRFSIPKSNSAILEDFETAGAVAHLETKEYKNLKYRFLTTQKSIDSLKPTVVFVHGAVGSLRDFSRYMKDPSLVASANMISYDRIGYGLYQTGESKASIAFERDMLEHLISTLNSESVIIVGYSYGGTIAMVSNQKYKKVILLAPAVLSEAEVQPLALKLYQWRLTRWLVPDTWKAASKEKISHADDLKQYEKNYNSNPNQIISIHGDNDRIVPYENSIYLKNTLAPESFELVTLEGAGHGLVWSRFEAIRNVILEQVKR